MAAWLLWLLARHPKWQQQVREEARNGEKATLEACLNEALRLFPPVWLVARTACRAVNLSGIALETGATVFISPWAPGRSVNGWEKPNEFRPER